MIYYHGSSTDGIRVLRPFLSNHDRPYVYLTHSEVLATLYAANPMTRPNGWFSYWWDKDGQLYYDEYFDGQLEEIYRGKAGYIYLCQGEYPALPKMPWVHLSEADVPVTRCQLIPDLCERLLQYEAEGRLIIRRWRDRTPAGKVGVLNVVRNSLQSTTGNSDTAEEYRSYIYAHFPELRP